MISKTGKHDKYCYFCSEDVSLIENYNEAVADTTQYWVIHHRAETHFSDGTERPYNAFISRDELKALGLYYNRPAAELIFMTRADHQALHNKRLKGRRHTEESKQKMREASLNMSEETRQKMRESAKNRPPISEETRRKMSEAQMGRPGTWTGRHHTEDQKRKTSEAMKRYWQKRREANK